MNNDCLGISCPIILPKGLKGDSVTGPAGANGTSLFVNTGDVGATNIGDTVMTSNTVTADKFSANNILDLDAVFTLPNTAQISFETYIMFGSSKVATFSFTNVVVPPSNYPLYQLAAPPTATQSVWRLKSKIYFFDLRSQIYLAETEIFGNPASIIKYQPIDCGINCASDVIFEVHVNITSNTTNSPVYCLYFTVTKSV
jgi:hypothetical protein